MATKQQTPEEIENERQYQLAEKERKAKGEKGDETPQDKKHQEDYEAARKAQKEQEAAADPSKPKDDKKIAPGTAYAEAPDPPSVRENRPDPDYRKETEEREKRYREAIAEANKPVAKTKETGPPHNVEPKAKES